MPAQRALLSRSDVRSTPHRTLPPPFARASARSPRFLPRSSTYVACARYLGVALAILLIDAGAFAASLVGGGSARATAGGATGRRTTGRRCKTRACKLAKARAAKRRLAARARRLRRFVQLKAGPGYDVLRPHRAWGTRKTVETLKAVLKAYHARFPKGPHLFVHDLSQRWGGRIKPHKSHRTGRDVDLRFVCKQDQSKRGKRRGRCRFSPEHNWFLVQELIATGQVQFVFTAYHVQRLLYRYARQLGLSRPALAELFQYPRARRVREGLIRHEPNHRCHFHIRFKRSDEPEQLLSARSGEQGAPLGLVHHPLSLARPTADRPAPRGLPVPNVAPSGPKLVNIGPVPLSAISGAILRATHTVAALTL